MLLPASVNECYQFAMEAFDLTEQLQDPGIRSLRSRYRHEQLDVRPVRLSRQATEAGKVLPRKTWTVLGGFER